MLIVDRAIISDVLAVQQPGAMVVMRRNATIFDARDRFAAAPRVGEERLSAIIVSDDGSPRGNPVGLVTPWDLVRLASY